MEKIKFKTEDGVEILGDYYQAKIPNGKFLLLLHMMPATKESYKDFAQKAQAEGFSSLAIDFRGHGQSRNKNGQTLNYATFSDKEHQDKILDVREAFKWLQKNKNASLDKIAVVGASIGANLALEALSENPEIKKAVLLSPGLDYRGVKTESFIKNLKDDQNVFIIASEEDSYSFDSTQALKKLLPRAKIKFLKNAGHGTTMLKKEINLSEEILEWLKVI